jgi:ABC-type Zn uptake system ZnuABC Zn-binding protein ZnuA
MKRLLIVPLILLATLGAIRAQAALDVVATTSILADVAQAVGGDLVTVTSLVPVGADTHAYQPTASDAVRVAQADLLLTVGAGYESFLGGLLENAGTDVPTVIVTNGLEILPYGHHDEDDDHVEATAEADHADEHLGVLGDDLDCAADEDHAEEDAAGEDHADEHAHGECDPHVWMDVQNVIGWANTIAAAFSERDPAHAEAYRANADAYIAELEALDTEIRAAVESLPEERRVFVTNHEFLAYYAHAYGFEIAATVLPGGATGSEVAPQELAALIDLVRAEGVPAIFAETSANPRIADALANEAGIEIATLYSESLGEAESGAATYIDMMRYNTTVIVEALSD